MQDYSPFGKGIGALTTADLIRLHQVSEGWYVEYKREVPTPKSVAKSVSAFANSRGGWLFYGVEAERNLPNCATGFPGMAAEDADSLLQRIRDSVSTNLSPVPFFELRTLEASENDAVVPKGRFVIAIHVPAGRRPPYVHLSGVVYVRVADRSDPIRETDRGRLQELFDRAEESRNGLSALITRESTWPHSTPSMRVLVMCDPYDDHRWRHALKFRDFADLMNIPAAGAIGPEGSLRAFCDSFSLPFPYVQSLSNGAYFGRQKGPGLRETMTWRLTPKCDHDITLPFPYSAIDSHADVSRWLQGYDHAQEFTEVWKSAAPGRAQLVDLSLLAILLMAIFNGIDRLNLAAKFEGYDGTLHCKLILHRLDRCVPYLDTSLYIDHVKQFGIPANSEGSVMIPGERPENLLRLGPWQSDAPLMNSLAVLFRTAGALGLPWGEDIAAEDVPEETMNHVYGKWLALFGRANEVQSRRQKQP